MFNSYILQYLRLLSYSVVVLTSILGILLNGCMDKLLLVGNLLIAVTMLSVYFLRFVAGINIMEISAIIQTPVTIIWAILHIISFFRMSKGEKSGSR